MNYSRENSRLYQLLLKGKKVEVSKGQLVSGLEDKARLYIVANGYVKRYLITSAGVQGIQVIYGPNDIFPLTPVYQSVFEMNIYSGPEQYYYEALTRAQLYSVSQEELLQSLDEKPELYKDLFHAAGLRLNSYIQRLESMSLRAAEKKVAHQLAYFANVFGKPTAQGIEIAMPLTHQTLADVLNLARETVTNCLNKLEANGLIVVAKNITVVNLDKLESGAD